MNTRSGVTIFRGLTALSDYHFGHTNILKYEDGLRRNVQGERFQSVADMDT